MKIESRIFEICTGFFFLAAIVYTVLSHEPVGIAALFLTAGLSLIIGTYFRFVSRRLEERPEDNPDAEVSDGAGDIGFAFLYVWLMVIAMIVLLITIGGLVFEYHIRPADH
jgi:hypothetical protein